MVLQALTRYYDILASDPENEIPLRYYSIAPVSFALNLSEDGKLLDIIPLFETKQFGKTTRDVPMRMIVPERVKRSSGINPNFLCDNPTYVLGLTAKEAKDPAYATHRFVEYRRHTLAILAGADCPEAKAVSLFLEGYQPDRAGEIPAISEKLERIINENGNLVFMLDGSREYVHNIPAVQRAWENHKNNNPNSTILQCLVTGETAPIERLHPSLKGIKGAQSSGATLVGFNAQAFGSYNREQGLNSPVSEKAVFAYSTALTHLLSVENRNRKINLGDTTVVYWAESPDSVYADLFAGLFEPQFNQPVEDSPGNTLKRDIKAEMRLKEIVEKVSGVRKIDASRLLEGLNPNTRFYVLGLAPNAARVSVRFFHMDPFAKTIEKILTHYTDMQIVKEFKNQPDLISIRQILGETVSKYASDKSASPLMSGAVFHAILENTPYPAGLYYAIINRIRAEVDDSNRKTQKINYVRAAVIKAFLTRKYRNQPASPVQEVLCMSLNEQSTLPAYLLGRLFAVLEKAQRDAAAPTKLNATIKDRYFTSACASPASVFPVLLRLSQHHISKAKYGYVSDRNIEKIMGLLDIENHPFPSHLNLDEQGTFILGYYHQRASFFVPGDNGSPVDESQTNQDSI